MEVSDRKEPYVLFMLFLSMLSLIGLAMSTSGHLDKHQAEILGIADNFICILFFLDFLMSLYRAPNRLKYFFTWGWLDLLSSLPMIDALRLTRLARVVRILRLVRGIKATKVLAQFILNRRAESAFLAVSLVSILLLVVSSIAVLQFESLPESNIKTAQDAVWWSITTITTVGYGDKFPITAEGRLIASLLMVCGVGLFGTLSGFIASWFLEPGREKQDAELTELIGEIRMLRKQLGVSSAPNGAATGSS
jgi:voltage-gated potassium channel